MSSKGREQATVLLVEDEDAIAEMFEEFLKDSFEVSTATSGPKALRRLDQDVSVVVLDRRMPEMSGDDVVGIIRERGYDCQVAMLTAIGPDGDILDLPIDAYLTKPVTRDRLVGTVESLSRRREFDEECRQLFRLASKKAALERANRTYLEEYRILESCLQEVGDDIDTCADRFGSGTRFPGEYAT